MRIPFISALAAGALALGGCAYGDMGMGVGLGYGGGYGNYGYSPYGGSYYGAGYGYSPYNYGYGGYGYGSPYYGWYDDYYYPGTGYYVYDSYRRPYAMSTTQRAYWSQRSPALTQSTTTTRTSVKPNWSTFDKRTERQQKREERQSTRRH